MHGQFHANKERVEPNMVSSVHEPDWFEQLNLDIRYRIGAGLGTELVKDKQGVIYGNGLESSG